MDDPNLTPGEAIKMALDERGWTHDDLARILGRHRPEITSLVSGKRSITPELAIALGIAFSNQPQYWLGLESSRQLRLIPQDPSEITRRLRLHQLAPITDMERRGWLRATSDSAALERQLCEFFGITDIDQKPVLDVAARKTDKLAPMSPEQRAWSFRARQLAAALPVASFDESKLPQCSRKLRELAAYPEEARKVPTLLAEYGVRFVVVEPLPHCAIDGAAFWLDHGSPVIATSVRFDRVDAFWFTLCHEFSHIRHRDSASVDADLVRFDDEARVDSVRLDFELRADAEAQDHLIPRDQMDSFIKRVGPLYSKERIVQFAHKVRIHPGIIVGQLQHRGEIKYSANREMLAKVRERVTSTAVTDGWKKTPGRV